MSWGTYGNAEEHTRYMTPTPSRSRRRCNCGCGKRETHIGMANGVALVGGCEWKVRLWIRDHNAPSRLASS